MKTPIDPRPVPVLPVRIELSQPLPSPAEQREEHRRAWHLRPDNRGTHSPFAALAAAQPETPKAGAGEPANAERSTLNSQ